MHHTGTRTIKTTRLTLRPFEAQDGPALYDNWGSDPEVTRYLTWPTYTDPREAQKMVDSWVAAYADPTFYQWAIVPYSLGQAIGSISVVSIDENVGQLEVGYCIGRPWWRQGYTAEALRAVRDYLFDEVGCLRLQARHDPNNPASGAVMRACGLLYEGTLRGADRNNQGIVDACVYGLLASDRA